MKQLFLPLILSFTLSGAACKKSSHSKPDCQIISITPERGSVANFYYDEKGRLSAMKSGDEETKIEYRTDSIIATETKSLNFIQRRICKMNAQGLPLLMRLEINASGSQWVQYKYEYNGTALIRSVNSNYANTATSTFEYTWSNGNLTGVKEGPNTRKFEYYNDKPAMRGDGFMFEMLSLSGGIEMLSLNGAVELVRNRNLLKKMEHTLENIGSYSMLYEYEFDKDGKIENIHVLNSNTNTSTQFACQYRCN